MNNNNKESVRSAEESAQQENASEKQREPVQVSFLNLTAHLHLGITKKWGASKRNYYKKKKGGSESKKWGVPKKEDPEATAPDAKTEGDSCNSKLSEPPTIMPEGDSDKIVVDKTKAAAVLTPWFGVQR